MKELINCPAERAIYFLGGKWKIRILFTLFNNKMVRFNELKKVFFCACKQTNNQPLCDGSHSK